jgi:serine/threonine protein kinase
MKNSPPEGSKPEPSKNEADALAAKEQALQEALSDFVDLEAKQEQVDVEMFCRKYPELQDELRPLLEALVAIDVDPKQPTVDSGNKSGSLESSSLPERMSGYKILSEIGAGGMGRVLLAYDEGLRRKVAIKTLKAEFDGNKPLTARFMQEARALAQLGHPNIVSIYSLGKADEPPHFVMEYVEGTTLLEAARALTIEQKTELIQKVSLAVDFLHQHGILHRDLKPANILVGADLEPRLLDFGLARQVDARDGRLTLAGELMGTPDYFSPEHARSGDSPDVRSDVFSLGTILYEMLTGTLPFRGETLGELMRNIREGDPPLPRRLNADLPGDLQNICLKALEKNPADRYGTAREMADDLERFLAGEKVLAAPTAYAHLMSGKIEQHLRELESWRRDEILSDYEWDSLRKNYGRLIEPDDAWILEARRLSVPQVNLYLGAWILILGAALLFLFRFVHLHGTTSVLVAAAACAITARRGALLWKLGQLRVAMAYLLAFCFLLPILFLIAMGEYGLWGSPAQNKDWELLWDLAEPFRNTTNAQLWWSIVLSLPAYLWLRRFTRSSVFSLVFVVMSLLLCHVTLLPFGLLSHFPDDPGWYYLRLIPVGLLFFTGAFIIERKGFPTDSRYFYPIAVIATLAALSGLAGFHEPYAKWLERLFPWTRGQIEYLFIINAGIYFVLQTVCGRFPSSQMRGVAKSFRFFIPGHVMTTVFFLGLEATHRWHKDLGNLQFKREARIFEVLLPVLACGFVYGGIPKQMKNYFVSGMVFLAIGIIRLQQDVFDQEARWPVILLILGLLLMLYAARYSAVKMYIARLVRRRS